MAYFGTTRSIAQSHYAMQALAPAGAASSLASSCWRRAFRCRSFWSLSPVNLLRLVLARPCWSGRRWGLKPLILRGRGAGRCSIRCWPRCTGRWLLLMVHRGLVVRRQRRLFWPAYHAFLARSATRRTMATSSACAKAWRRWWASSRRSPAAGRLSSRRVHNRLRLTSPSCWSPRCRSWGRRTSDRGRRRKFAPAARRSALRGRRLAFERASSLARALFLSLGQELQASAARWRWRRWSGRRMGLVLGRLIDMGHGGRVVLGIAGRWRW